MPLDEQNTGGDAGRTVTHRLPRAGDVIGRYKLIAELGEGAIGCVFKAHHEDLDHIRALKILKPGLPKEQYRRFVNEARVCAKFDHPNLVRVHGISLWDDTLPFIEQEYVDGPSLDKWINERGKIPADVAVAVISLIAAGLEHTQGREYAVRGVSVQGLVHRDIKPQNILISRDGAAVKLADFGLAQMGPPGLQTHVDVTLGTWVYFSPEQHRGRRPDLRSDIYSLGLVLYEMIAGARAFPETDMSEMAEAKENARYVSLGARGIEAPEFVEFLVAKCLRADIDRRYRTYGSLKDAAESALSEYAGASAGSVVEHWAAAPDRYTTPKAAPRKARGVKRMRMIAAALIVVCAAAACVFVALRLASPAANARKSIDMAPARDAAARPPAAAVDSSSRPEPAGRPAGSAPAASAPAAPGEAQSAPRVPRESPAAGKTPRAQAAAKVTSLRIAITAFNRGEYGRAIQALEDPGSRSLAGASADSLRLILLGSYLMLSNDKPEYLREAAAQLNAGEPINDGYYLLCEALIALASGAPAQAPALFDKAVATKSLLGPMVKRESLYQRALYYTRTNEKTHSAADERRMLDSWREFHDYGCKTKGEGCDEARKALDLSETR